MLRSKITLHNASHVVDISHQNCLGNEKQVYIQVFEFNNILEIKLRDSNEYSFNYTSRIDWNGFEKIKSEQSLEISYEEFKLQIVELLKQTLSKEMLLKLEVDLNACKLIFYEKSRIKSLIFLSIDLELTNQNEIIDEMAASLLQLKEANKKLSCQLVKFSNEISEKESSLRSAKKLNFDLEKQFCRDLQLVETSFVKSISFVEKQLSDKLQKINLRHLKLTCDLERVKSENKLKGESSGRLVQSLQNMRLENEKHFQTVRNLQMEVDNLSMLRTRSEKNCCELKQVINRKDGEITELQRQINELRKDMRDATMIIAQKTKTHEELAKDLVQANTMIVNFNNNCDQLSEEVEELKAALTQKESVVLEQAKEIRIVSEEFDRYKEDFKAADMNCLRHELLVSKQRMEDLERQNREAAKLNAILTKKLSNGDFFR